MAATLEPALVQDVWDALCDATRDEIHAWNADFRRRQPAIVGFLRAAEEEIFQDDDRGALLLHGLWAWRAFLAAHHEPREIDEDDLEAAYTANERTMFELEASTAANVMDTAADWTETYRQMPLLAAILQQAMSGDLAETRRVDDFLGLIILHMKTVIDCLDAV